MQQLVRQVHWLNPTSIRMIISVYVIQSSNKKIVSVTSKGKLKALKAGTTKITVKAGKKKFVIKVTVPKKKK